MDRALLFGSVEYLAFLLLLLFSRGMDFLSTWIATPNLILEANPIARKLRWKWGIPVNLALCLAFARWPLTAIIISTTSPNYPSGKLVVIRAALQDAPINPAATTQYINDTFYSTAQGAKSIRQLELLTRPPMQRAADNPWPEWPKVYKLDYGQEEAAALWGEDPRRYSTTTRRFIGRNEHVTGIEIADITMAPGPDGRIGLREVPGTSQVIPAETRTTGMSLPGKP